MPKQKTHKAAAKRFKQTGSGAIVHYKKARGKSTIAGKAAKRARSKAVKVYAGYKKVVKKLLPGT